MSTRSAMLTAAFADKGVSSIVLWRDVCHGSGHKSAEGQTVPAAVYKTVHHKQINAQGAAPKFA